MSDNGPPCENCRRDGFECEAAATKGYRALAWRHKSQAIERRNSIKASENTARVDAPVFERRGSRGSVRQDAEQPHIPPIIYAAPDAGSRQSLHAEAVGQQREASELPQKDVVSAMIQCYFRYVHSFLPVVDPSAFLGEHQTSTEEQNEPNRLLLSSMLFATCNFIDDGLLLSTGYGSRMSLKRAMYQHAKALYHSTVHQDKIALIQSALLLSFSNADAHDPFTPWHWNGIAIDACQSLGVHLAPRPAYSLRGGLPRDDFRMRRLIWWNCYGREVWLSLASGRPVRVAADDCDTPLPSREDTEACLANLSEKSRHDHIPRCVLSLLQFWDMRLRLSLYLGEVLSAQRQPEVNEFLVQEMEQKESEIRAVCKLEEEPSDEDELKLFLLHQCLTGLCLEAVIISLYKPLFRTAGVEANGDFFHSKGFFRARMAALNSNHVLNKLIGAGLISSCSTATVIALLPVMQIHLLELVSQDSMIRSSAQSHLDTCLMVLDKVRATDCVAESALAYFSAARDRVWHVGQGSLQTFDLSVSSELDANRPLSGAPYDVPDSQDQPFQIAEGELMTLASSIMSSKFSTSRDIDLAAGANAILSASTFGELWQEE
ncbi:hypothetical protein HIM_09362 [Hirsutella minnesotensis 3608]|uniref:Xylanolytic transcriptional activator regulatory domain-containing protein n=1 Tax=Hirsutella minnesotensis 3608 TaxID=1043627 RepID=A0A0F8A351_9HYPO|nr:hypothetical protein HIM_09362 [Hirsutella minnesotensis 3608]